MNDEYNINPTACDKKVKYKKSHIMLTALNWGLLTAITSILIFVSYIICALSHSKIQQMLLYRIIGRVSIDGYLLSAIFSFVVCILIPNKLVPESQRKWLIVKRIIAGILIIGAFLLIAGGIIISKLEYID